MSKCKFRNLILASGMWLYRIGKGSVVIISPTGNRYITDQSKITGLSWDALERGYWKGWFKGIGPGDIRKWIETNLTTSRS